MFVIQNFSLQKYFNGELACFVPITGYRGWEAMPIHIKSSFSPEAEQPTKIVTLHLCDLRRSRYAVSSPEATKLQEPAIRQKYAVSSALYLRDRVKIPLKPELLSFKILCLLHGPSLNTFGAFSRKRTT